MSAANQVHIFQPFSQAHSGIARKFGGTALIISICNKLLNLMCSELKVQNTIGIGSQFYFHLHLPEVDEIITLVASEKTQDELFEIGILGMIHKPYKPIDIKRLLTKL